MRLVEERLTGKLDSSLNSASTERAGLQNKIDYGLAGASTERAGLHDKIDGLHAKIDSSIAGLRGEILFAMARQTRTIVFTMVGIATTIWLALLLPIGGG